MPDLLLELLSEEIPARMQARAAEDLRRLVTEGLVERGLTYAHATAFVTPRRLALAVAGLAERSAALREERKGPRVDAPEKALEGFLRSTGLAREDLEIRDDRKSQVWFAVTERPGRAAAAIVAETVEAVVRGFPWPKSMRWGEGGLRWVRPLHGILCQLSTEAGSEIVPLEIEGIRAGDTTRGHRFMAPETIRVSGVEDYAARLERARVLLDPAERAGRIRHDAKQLAFAQGLEVVEDEALLAEIAGLVEWPVVLMGRIGERFLDLPPEVLQTSMKAHQKFLSVRDPNSARIVGYVVVANRETADDGATILAGNARVLAARLADAAFFWENDLRMPPEAMVAKLDGVTFHNRLGSQGERIARIAALAREIAPLVGADPDLAERAARLAKADLASEMVYEFPELQGVMGRYYAERAGEDPAVAAAAEEHYSPLGPNDAVPKASVSVAVALADKLDTLAGHWWIPEKPTGSRDPFALRRAGLGAIRLILGNDLRLKLTELLIGVMVANMQASKAAEAISRAGLLDELEKKGLRQDVIDRAFEEFASESISDFSDEEIRNGLLEVYDLIFFLTDRLKVHLRGEGIRHDVIDAAFQLGGQDDLMLLVARVRALQDFLGTEDGANLLAGYKRAVNILSQEEKKDGVEYSLDPHPSLAETDAERALFTALDAAEVAIAPALDAEDFAGAMTALAGLRGPIDAFFDTTIVNAESDIVRRNRLCLLHRIRTVMNRVAVFSAVEGG
ncbi:MAG TPA: glycine--tRNA ligase subunit beta [Amaricoccus sp.]|uniref:glycine--tRNA ligase subunit beta n=1 Tax=Amaricoccus sp. TaxID=1872485 RepID=UPI002D0C9C65|nr:glycine--tRNA ligase subunit beta [Amaricoccus sp.]HMQ93495.1 glycine--tRNA ligase subunit beta [Amaricoccus sp.]HMR52182.1 glycine--tRNA ligase subunit beta [Amaricoccus sp.]HMR59511.1 glycine--tRNA ligase subunit beta [Amaricoccus sp.]HMT99034.1 glycine--tRNA ligase subunit beta [Amaricoccus sp.]